MSTNLSILAVIPARGSSKGVPRKNIRPLGGRPLIAWTIEAALRSNCLTDVVVSTEDEEIATIADQCGALVPFLRPAELATDAAPSFPVVMHALDAMQTEGRRYDAVLMLQPTSPFRTAEDISEAAMLLASDPEADSVVSVIDVCGQHPFRMKRMVGKRLVNFIDQGFEDMRPRQEIPSVYIRSGSIYLNHVGSLVRNKSLVGPVCLGMLTPAERALNIDDEMHFRMAEMIVQERGL